MFFYFKESQP